MLNIVEILSTPKLVTIYFDLFQNTKIVRVQNRYFDGFFFVICGLFLITFNETVGKIEKRVK